MLFSYIVITFLRVDRSLGGSIACIFTTVNKCVSLIYGQAELGLGCSYRKLRIFFSPKFGNHS